MKPTGCFRRAAGLALLLVPKGAAFAQTIYVDTSDDVVDFGGAQQVANLPGPDGKISLAEAGLASDNTPGVQTIGFRIPQGEWLYQQFFPGRAVLRPLLGFRVFDTVLIDATTQTAFTGDTYPDGGEVVLWAESYLIDNVGGGMKGFDHSSIHLSGGSGNVVQGNTETSIELFDSSANLIGGTHPGEGNRGFVIQVDRANRNVVVGNTVHRVRVLGWFGGGMPASNNRIGGPSLAERNHIIGSGTVDEHGIPGGFAVQLFDSIGTIVENNWIGMTVDGMSIGDSSNTIGIWFDGENHDATIRDNRIAGILAHASPPQGPGYDIGSGIAFTGTGSGVTIVGNKVGLDADDKPVLGSVEGISTANHYLGPIQGVVIGGEGPGEGNEIAGHHQTAVRVSNTYQDLRISGNSIHDNGGLGIDLVTDGFATGVTANDVQDTDTGANGLQNFPVIQSATRAGGELEIVGALSSSPSSNFTVEFFASPACDSSGYGEGRIFLGSTSVATNGSGGGSFAVQLPSTAPAGSAVTATATQEPGGATSEFSLCTPITEESGQSFCFGDGSAAPCPCGNTGLAGRGCQNSASTGGALLVATGMPSLGADTLQFTTSNELSTALSVVLQGSLSIAPLHYGDGLRCVGGTLKRLRSESAVGGAVVYPDGAETPVSVRSAALGDPLQPGSTRYYQVSYRDANASFCPPPSGSTFDVSNGIAVTWIQ